MKGIGEGVASYMKVFLKRDYAWKAVDQWASIIPQRLDEARDKIAEKRVEERESGFRTCSRSSMDREYRFFLSPPPHIVGIPVGRGCCWVEIGRCGLFHV